MRLRRTPIAALIAGLSIAAGGNAHAVALGEVVSLSAIGAPLRIEIRSLDGRIDDAADCLRIAQPADRDGDIPLIKKARIGATGSGTATRIVISSPQPVLEPAVRIVIEDVCQSRLTRSYTLLMPYPETPVAAPQATPAAAPAPRPPAPRAATPAAAPRPKPAAPPASGQFNQWSTAPGESLATLAASLYPDDPGARRRFIVATARANPELFPDGASQSAVLPAGTELVVPDLRRLANAPVPRSQTPDDATPGSPPRAEPPPGRTSRPAPRPAQEPDRLVVANDPSPDQQTRGTAPGETPTGDAAWSARERELATAVDRTIVAQMELLARIKELEQLQAELEARAARLGVEAPAPAPAPAAIASPAVPAPPAPAPAPAPAPVSEGERSVADFGLIGGLGVLTLGLVALLLRNRRRDGDAAVGADSAPTVFVPERVAPTPVAAAAPVAAAPAIQPAVAAGSMPPASDAARAIPEPEVEEHDSAIELAEIMMSFGRVHGAAETLADFIRNNPKQAVTPWLKLLDVYRAAGMRAEFDGLARQLNKTFNVKTVTWDNFELSRQTPDSLEQMPHILDRLTQIWGTRECQAYINSLLRDNRDGTRQGFPLNIVDELLLLSAILEQHHGPYRPEIDTAVASADHEGTANA